MWSMGSAELVNELEFAEIVTALAKRLIPLADGYSFNNELIYEYIKRKRDKYVSTQNSTGLFNLKK